MMIERGSHPRFAIGESTSPLMNLIIEQLAARYDLPRLMPLTSYGAWQRAYPEIVCGLKRGFTYFKHETGQRYRTADDRRNQLLVAASPNDEVADTHWLRADMDHFLLNEALALGIEYLDQTEVHSLDRSVQGTIRLSGSRAGKPVEVTARLLIDASGPRGLLSRMLNLGHREFDDYPPTQALYSHFTGVHRCEQMDDYSVSGLPPYPPDDAAVHHVFDGGWMWVLRFNNGVTSAGIVVTDELALELRISEGKAAWQRFLLRFPSIAAQFGQAEAIREFTWLPRLTYRSARVAGNGWALLPAAAAFVDPLFSTGMPLALLGVERIGRILENEWGRAELNRRWREYAEVTLAEADHTAQFIAGCYASFPQFECFTAFSMFYFAAASFSEMARRLERGHLVRRFLAADHSSFATATEAMSGLLRQRQCSDPVSFAQQVNKQIAPLNIAGLCNQRKHNWYNVDFEDVIAGADKFGIPAAELRETLRTASWAQADTPGIVVG